VRFGGLLLLGLLTPAAVSVLAWRLVDRRTPNTRAHTHVIRHDSRPAKPRARSLVERTTGSLAAPLQDAAAVTLGDGRAMLLGGLTAADTSSDGIEVAGPARAHRQGALPAALHDTAAVRLGTAVYLFGGGAGTRQLDSIVRVDPRSGAVATVGRLPAPSSDQAAAAIGGTAYVIGGYTGSRWLDTIVAWRPGSAARVVGHLPQPVRYAAVTGVGRLVVIAGGSLPNGTASTSVFAFDPERRHVSVIGRLPRATTHAAAAALGRVAYVIGGRSAVVGTPTARITAVDIAARRTRPAGRLASPRSDLAAVSSGSHILLAGGRGPAGTESRISELLRGKRRRTVHRTAVATAGVYAHDGRGMLAPAARAALPRIYVPNSESSTVDVIDPRTYRIVAHFDVGALPQHVVPAWDLRTLYVTNDLANTLTPINPRTAKAGASIPVDDPYNMYFTLDGRYAIVVAERLRRLDFRDAHTFKLRHSLAVPCVGIDHMDFSANGGYLLASCEFSGQLVMVNVKQQRVVRVLDLPDGRAGMPQDVKLSPDGKVFYIADLHAGGLWEVGSRRLKVTGFLPTGSGVHGLYPSRDARYLYATNRGEGSISVISFRTRKVVRTWRIPGGGSPDMGGVSADGKVLWLSGRYSGVVYAIATRTGKLLAKIPVGQGPHGLCVWPQPGRYSLGHTGDLR
jgi:DNA-binding beta-propeller fold protein YncE